MYVPLFSIPRSRSATRFVAGIAAGVSAVVVSQAASAGVSLLQIPKRIDANQPLTLTLLITEDGEHASYRIPETLIVSASADMVPAVQLILKKDDTAPRELTLQPGQFRKINFTGTIPRSLRGLVRIEPIGIDAAPMLTAMIRPDPSYGPLPPSVPVDAVALIDSKSKDAPIAPGSSVITPGAMASATTAAPADIDLANAPRLSFNEPMYFALGNNGGTNAKFQLSFKFRVFQPDDPRSRGLLDNLYLGYTQFSLWDLHSASAPFRDTNYRPSIYYALPDIGGHVGPISRISFATGLEHESNGRDGVQSRGINYAFIQPGITFGNLNDYQLTIQPKIYAYMGPKSDNPDIASYRGHMDLRIQFQKPGGIGLATTLRRGSGNQAGSADTQLTYPLAQLIPGTVGYLMASYFYGYGESLLTYNVKERPQFRIGYALSR